MEGARNVAEVDARQQGASNGTGDNRLSPLAPLARAFEQVGTLVRLARHQQLAIAPATDDCCYLIRCGTVALETTMPARHILGFWHDNDLLETAQTPALPQLALRALEASELWRLRRKASKSLFAELPDMRTAHQEASATTLKRMIVVNAMLGRLDGETRLISFLVSTALRLGHVAGNRVTMRLPMSRADIADHLSLNPDTLSRIVTGLKDAGLIETHGRYGLTVRDWRGLRARTPLAAALDTI
jgi:CRP-like cAMP-binding protein